MSKSGKYIIMRIASVSFFMFLSPFIFSSCMNQRPASAQPDSLTASSPIQETSAESSEEQTDTESTDEQEDTVEFHDKAVESEVSFLLGKGNYSITVGDMETDTKKIRNLLIYTENAGIFRILYGTSRT